MAAEDLARENLALARATYVAMCSSPNLEAAARAVDEYFAPEFVAHGPHPGITPDLAGTRQWTAAIIRAAPDYYVHVDDQFAVDDKVVTRWTARGTHQGEFQGIPPTGRQITVTGITVSRYAGGKIVESWFEWDTLDLMRQLGAYPPDGGWRGVTGGITLNITINKA
jgi:steroid delta-isomerase-like uncharacterized protein